jgi:hypothetical protein
MTGMIGFALACADSPAGPAGDLEVVAELGKGDKGGPPKDGGDTGGGEPDSTSTSSVLHWKSTLNKSVSDTEICKPDRRCRLSMQSVGTYVTIPRGAVSENVTVTVTAIAGDEVKFDFQPHGTQFLKDIQVDVDIRNTVADGMEGQTFEAWYWVDDLNTVLEVFQAKVLSGYVIFTTDHFSGYALAM